MFEGRGADTPEQRAPLGTETVSARGMGSVVAFVVACLLRAGGALYNGYPLVHFDTGTYVSSSFTFAVPLRRPVAYGLLLAPLHAGTTLWTVVFAQAALIVAPTRSSPAAPSRRSMLA